MKKKNVQSKGTERGERGFTQPHFSEKSGAGFTLIEMVVATGLFMILVVSAISIVISVSRAQAHVQKVQAAIDNVRFSLELLTKEMRVGVGYEYYSDCNPTGPAKSGFQFVTSEGDTHIYYLDHVNQRIMRSETSACADAVPFTAEEVRVERLYVELRGHTGGSSDGQPWAVLNLRVSAPDLRGGAPFTMDIQTTVTQRIRDFP